MYIVPKDTFCKVSDKDLAVLLRNARYIHIFMYRTHGLKQLEFWLCCMLYRSCIRATREYSWSLMHMGVSQKQGYHFWGPYTDDYNMLWSILGPPYRGKLPSVRIYTCV